MKTTRNEDRYSAERLSSTAKRQRYEAINRRVIEHPRMKRILRLIDDCREMSKAAREPECMIIMGAPGVGKTTLRDHYLSKHPRRETPKGTEVPVLAVTTPVPAKISSMASTLLAALGDPFPEKGATDTRTRRLYRLLKKCRVELIFLDEFHHFIDRDNSKVTKSVSDWLKNLISEMKIPVVLTGLPAARGILEANDQLRRRFSREVTFDTCSGYLGGRSELRMLLKKVQESLDYSSQLDFSEESMARRFRCATQGNISRTMKIARGAAFLAIKHGQDEVTLSMLAQAYAERLLPVSDIQRSQVAETNPFHPDWKPKVVQSFTTPTDLRKQETNTAQATSPAKVKASVAGVFGK